MNEDDVIAEVATALAERFLAQPKDMPWEARSDELARAALATMRAIYDISRVARLNEVKP